MGWSAPFNDGASPVIGYRVPWDSGGQSIGDDSSRERAAPARGLHRLLGHKIAALVVGVYSVVGMAALVDSEHVQDADIKLSVDTGRFLTLAILIWMSILGVGL